MKLAITLSAVTNSTTPVVLAGGLEEAIGFASDLGYDGLELHFASPLETPLDEIIRHTKAKNIAVSAFATGRSYTRDGLSLIDSNPKIREEAIGRLKSFVDEAAPFEATVILGCIRGNLLDPAHKEDSLSLLAESTREVALYAKNKNVQLVFEAINRYENNYLNNAAETLEFIEKHNIPNTKLLLDTFHMNIEEADICKAVEESKGMIGYVHFADNNRLFPGSGHIPFGKIVDSLKVIDYKGYISAECLPLPTPEEAAKAWIKTIKPLILED